MNSIDHIRESVPLYIKRVADILLSSNFEAYLVGGSVRDLLLDRIPSDFDIATNATPDQVQELFDRSINTGARFGTITVVMEDRDGERKNVEVTTYRSESEYVSGRWPVKVEFSKTIDEDLKRRDFTINAFALNLERLDEVGAILEDIILDLFNGQEDLKNRLIRAVGDPNERFSEDGLRPIRAARLASQLSFEIEEGTFNAIPRSLDIVKQVAVERVKDEIMKMLLKSPKPSVGIEYMRKSGILEIYIPELLETVGVVQPEYHVDDVYTHLLKSVDMAQDEVKLAALLHDIGKARTQSEDEKGVHFYEHDVVGAKMAETILKRLKFSNREIEHTVTLIRYHMFYYPSADWRKQENGIFDQQELERIRQEKDSKVIGGWSDGAIRRFIIRVGGIDNLNDLIKLRIADASANPKSTFSNVEITALQERIADVLAKDAAMKLSDLRITGHDLQALGIPAGPKVGEILKELLDMVIEEPDLNTKEELEQIVKSKYLV